jgi:septum formation inhibitor-activating ATPase MinD
MTKTTIEVTNNIKDALREERLETESNYNDTIARLLGEDNTGYVTESEVRRIVSDMVVLEALE